MDTHQAATAVQPLQLAQQSVRPSAASALEADHLETVRGGTESSAQFALPPPSNTSDDGYVAQLPVFHPPSPALQPCQLATTESVHTVTSASAGGNPRTHVDTASGLVPLAASTATRAQQPHHLAASTSC